MVKRKNIGIIIDNISHRAGIERAVVNLGNLLVQSEKYNVTIFSLYTMDYEYSYYHLNKCIQLVHLRLRNNTILNRFYSYVKLVVKSRKFLKDANIDVLIGTRHAINCLMVVMPFSCKKVGCEHFNYDSCAGHSRKIRKLMYPFLDAIVLLTQSDAEHYTFINREKLYIIQNSLSFECDNPSKLNFPRIISAGRLEKQKGYDFLIKASSIVKKELPDWHIDIYGNGEEKEALLSLCEKYQVGDYITIKDTVKNIKDELLMSSIYVMTSRFEGFPMILLEAQACGLPIVSFDCPEGPAEIVSPGVDGELVEPGDIEMFATKLVEIAKNPELREVYGKNAYQASKRFSADKIFQKWHCLLIDITS